MIFAAHEDDRPATTVSAPASTARVVPLAPVVVPAARRAPEREGGPVGPSALTPAPLDAIRAGGTAVVERADRLDDVVVGLEADAAAVTWALRLVLLGVVGLVLLLTVLL